MQKYLIDSSIVIDALRQNRALLKDLETVFIDSEGHFYISVITVAELFSGKSAQEQSMRQTIFDIMSAVTVISLEQEIAVNAGDLRCQYGITLADAMIAATAQSIGATLVTRDKLFKAIREIESLVL